MCGYEIQSYACLISLSVGSLLQMQRTIQSLLLKNIVYYLVYGM